MRLPITGLVLAWFASACVAVSSADTVGDPCDDWMRIGTDSTTGAPMFCASEAQGDADSPLVWLAWNRGAWGPAPDVGPVASPCRAAQGQFGRSSDGYVVWCQDGVWTVYGP